LNILVILFLLVALLTMLLHHPGFSVKIDERVDFCII
jgi:hypothetical protein